jgi:ribosomal-protein-alanine acetyltransferase
MGDDEEVTVRRAIPADLDAIMRIQTACGTAAQWGPEGYVECDVAVAEWGCEVAGFIVFRLVAGDEGEILNLAVDPGRRRLGVGMRLLRHALAAGAEVWYLEVRASNEAAVQFYRRAGFRAVGTRHRYYSNPVEDAVVMRMGS